MLCFYPILYEAISIPVSGYSLFGGGLEKTEKMSGALGVGDYPREPLCVQGRLSGVSYPMPSPQDYDALQKKEASLWGRGFFVVGK